MKIVFMGTPEFAVPSLEILLNDGYEIVGVITAADKPAGRGNKIQISPVKEFAIKRNLKVLQPEKLKSAEFISQLQALNADLVIVVAFRMLPDVVWKMPPLGTFNLHGSLLPQYRGAAPINWAVMNGEKETGATTFFIDAEIDTGKILFSEKLEIGENATAGDIHDEMMVLGSKLVLKTVKAIEKNEIAPVKQSQFVQSKNALKPAPKLTKENCKINWHTSNAEVHNHIRGLSPYPGAWTEFRNLKNGEVIQVKIFSTRIENDELRLNTGEIMTDKKTYMAIGTRQGCISVKNIQFPGKKRLEIDAFLKGQAMEHFSIVI